MSDYEGSRDEFWHMFAELGEEPAFIARARAPEIALEELLRQCRARREELLDGPRLHWSALASRVGGDWSRLAPLLSDHDGPKQLAKLKESLGPPKPVRSDWLATDKTLLQRLVDSIERFNWRWQQYLNELDLEPVNQPRRDYNQFYVLEKSAAVLHERIEDTFEPLAMIDVAYLERLFPPLDVPQ